MKHERTTIHRILCTFAIGLGITIGSPVRAEVIHGVAHVADYNLSGYSITVGIDFSTQLTFQINVSNLDLSDLQASIPVGLGGCSTLLISSNGTTGQAVPGTNLEDLTLAPEPPYCCIPDPELNETCVLLTADGLYVKYAVRAVEETQAGGECISGQVEIEFFVQMDGTPDFGPLLPVKASTWGGVKALYR